MGVPAVGVAGGGRAGLVSVVTLSYLPSLKSPVILAIMPQDSIRVMQGDARLSGFILKLQWF